MPEENEKVEDFISLWKKKIATDNRESIIGDSLNKAELLQKENEDLRRKITENIELITKSEEILKNAIQEKEKAKTEKEEALTELTLKNQQLEQENSELNVKVKSMIKLLLEKDEEIKTKSNIILQLQTASSGSTSQSSIDNSLVEDLRTEISKKKSQIDALESKVSELTKENEGLNEQLVKNLKAKPVDYTIPIESKPSAIKPSPPQTPNLPLETLCQDLQKDLNKYKRIVEKLTEEKSQLKKSLEDQGVKLSSDDIISLKSENETLKKDLEELRKALKSKEIEVTQAAMRQVEDRINKLESKLKEKENIIAELKLTSTSQASSPSGPMSALIEDLQNNINKLKTTISEKDKEIARLSGSQ